MRKKLLLCVIMLMGVLLMSCTKDKVEKKHVDMELEGMIAVRYYFSEDEILVATGDRFMSSDWDEIGFDYICTDPLCAHKSESCTAVSTLDSAESMCAVEYNGKLIMLKEYEEFDREDISETIRKETKKYYVDIYEAELDGSNRKHKLTVEGSVKSEDLYANVIVAGGYVWFGGTKSDCTISELDKGYTYSCENAVFAVDLSDYTVKEYALEKDVTALDCTNQFAVGEDGVYVSKYSSGENTTSIYYIDVGNDTCELIFKGEKCHIIGELEDRLFYYDDEGNMYYRELSNPDEEKAFTGEGYETGGAVIIRDTLAVMSKCVVQDGAYDIEYTFYDGLGNVVEKQAYDKYVGFYGEIGDKILYVNPFDKEGMWWTDTDDLSKVPETGIYIGTFLGYEHDTLD